MTPRTPQQVDDFGRALDLLPVELFRDTTGHEQRTRAREAVADALAAARAEGAASRDAEVADMRRRLELAERALEGGPPKWVNHQNG